MNQALVGIHNLLQVDCLIHIVGELGILVELLVTCHDFLDRLVGLYHFCSEDATGEVATVRDEVDGCIEITLCLLQTLTNLWHVLMVECLVDAHVVVAP